ncbi:hypothetical protein LCGC14_1481860 [marine sediment metagenome]|uniref:NAD-dependent epimerase/dehydratase domain-containing protein n=1 Tax=marine sediment metagenome TaxID=412755 RepID=A0A0F9MB49_9ZZZZ
MERILVTGNLGYIGMILSEDLLNEGFDIVGVDTNFYRDNKLHEFEFSREFLQINKDIRELGIEDLKGFDSIIHLAALSNDPLGKLKPTLTNDINFKGSLRLAKVAKEAKVKRFLFSSSCSIYGATDNKKLNENDSLQPLTVYAQSKVNLEQGLSELADDTFSPCYLRNSTAYGISPNMRFDLVINNLMGWAFVTKQIKILSDGKAWRPLVHVRDISNAFIAALKAPKEIIHNEAFNVGVDPGNYQVKTMAEEIQNLMNECEIKILGEKNPDNRNYIVSFDKIKNNLKHFKPNWNLKKGIEEIYNLFNEINLNFEDFEDKNFTRLKQLKYLIENKFINDNLYWN